MYSYRVGDSVFVFPYLIFYRVNIIHTLNAKIVEIWFHIYSCIHTQYMYTEHVYNIHQDTLKDLYITYFFLRRRNPRRSENTERLPNSPRLLFLRLLLLKNALSNVGLFLLLCFLVLLFCPGLRRLLFFLPRLLLPLLFFFFLPFKLLLLFLLLLLLEFELLTSVLELSSSLLSLL